MGRLLATVGLALGAAGVILQFTVALPESLAVRGLPATIVWFFSYFTILTNTAVVLAYAATLSGRPAWFVRPGVKAGIAVAIAVVMIVYVAILAALWEPQGLQLLADTILHYATPVLYLVWWLGYGRDGTSRLADLARWLVYPLIYLGWTLLRGAFVAEYPYPFLDLAVKSAAQVATSVLMMVALFVVVGLLAIAADRLLPRVTDRQA